MRGFARTAVLLVLALLVSPAGLLACGWECAPEAVRPSAAVAMADCHPPAAAAAPDARHTLAGLPHDCATHAVASATELTTPRQPDRAPAPAPAPTALIDAVAVAASLHGPADRSAPPPSAPPASPIPLRI